MLSGRPSTSGFWKGNRGHIINYVHLNSRLSLRLITYKVLFLQGNSNTPSLGHILCLRRRGFALVIEIVVAGVFEVRVQRLAPANGSANSTPSWSNRDDVLLDQQLKGGRALYTPPTDRPETRQFFIEV